jgi:hypothetical protein
MDFCPADCNQFESLSLPDSEKHEWASNIRSNMFMEYDGYTDYMINWIWLLLW